MSTRLPTLSIFPTYLHLTITPPPSSSPQLTNVLILLHGLGGTSASFTNLGKQLSLPETTCISLQAPSPLPFELGGFHWGDDIQFDLGTGNMEFDTGFTKIVKIIREHIVEGGLVRQCGYEHREIMFFGFGQGAMAAIAAGTSMTEELGGILSIGGSLPSSSTSAKGVKTPLLVLGGSSNTMITKTAITTLKSVFQNVEYHRWSKAGDGMPQNRDEMLPIMRFFARQLKSRKGVPKGSVEIG
ncbi:hypothetical protein N7G274_006526 [Stereocaulon virgatum]|uniref:Phospholipase/carboxylesterase/thioesterase domain-containing protein n=1 Tax=Stereocaulon virgatum TaxID=373712 RepID=A0ABR4A833_9LECA